MRYIGIALIAMAAFLASATYRSMLSARVATLESFLELVVHVRSRVCEYLEPPSSWAADHRCTGEGVCRMLERIRGGESAAEAYRAVESGLALSREGRELLGAFFSQLGRGTPEAEREGIGRAADRLSALLEKERDECGERGRVAAVLALMLSAGGAILII